MFCKGGNWSVLEGWLMATDEGLLRKFVRVCKEENVDDVVMTGISWRASDSGTGGSNSRRIVEILHIMCLFMIKKINDFVRKMKL